LGTGDQRLGDLAVMTTIENIDVVATVGEMNGVAS